MKYLLVILSLSFLSCQRSKYSSQETDQFLEAVTTNAKASIGDITEIEKKPTEELYILTRYALSKTAADEYNKTNFSIKNKDDDISDFASYEIKDYELVNEKNEQLKLVDFGRANYLRETGLWTYDRKLNQNLAIDLKLNKNYERLKGFINIQFKLSGKVSHERKIPVNITVYDKIPE